MIRSRFAGLDQGAPALGPKPPPARCPGRRDSGTARRCQKIVGRLQTGPSERRPAAMEHLERAQVGSIASAPSIWATAASEPEVIAALDVGAERQIVERARGRALEPQQIAIIESAASRA